MQTELYYQMGFNEGYLIAKYNPELGDKLGTIQSASSRIEGLHDGRREYVLEHIKEIMPSRTNDDRTPSRDFNKSKNMDFGPER